jgi:hypothetical protein
MTRIGLLLLLVLASLNAHAQRNVNTAADYSNAVVLVGTMSPMVVFDILIANNLLQGQDLRKGFGINGIVFGGVATMVGALMAYVNIVDTSTRPGWVSAQVGLAALGAGTVVAAVFGLLRRAPERRFQEPLEDDRAPATPGPVAGLFPQLGLTARGGVSFGLAGAF